jgi:hypothetical protein
MKPHHGKGQLKVGQGGLSLASLGDNLHSSGTDWISSQNEIFHGGILREFGGKNPSIQGGKVT